MYVKCQIGLQIHDFTRRGRPVATAWPRRRPRFVTAALELSLVDVETPQPKADEVVVRVEASPLNAKGPGLASGAFRLGLVRDGA